MTIGVGKRVLALRAAIIVVGLTVAIGSFGLGRTTARPPSGAAAALPARPAGTGADYAAGFQAGRAVGVQEGRALQVGQTLSGSDRDAGTAAFASGYVAGINDAFGGYDGGWSLSLPYLITLDAGSGGATYRMASRLPMQAGVDYFLCPDGSGICQKPHHG
jgi:hypothetical protein